MLFSFFLFYCLFKVCCCSLFFGVVLLGACACFVFFVSTLFLCLCPLVGVGVVVPSFSHVCVQACLVYVGGFGCALLLLKTVINMC